MKKLIVIGLFSFSSLLLASTGGTHQSIEQQLAQKIKTVISSQVTNFKKHFIDLKEFYKQNPIDVDTIIVENGIFPGKSSLGEQIDRTTLTTSNSNTCQSLYAKIVAALLFDKRTKKSRHPHDMLREYVELYLSSPTDDLGNSTPHGNHLERFFENGEYNMWKIPASADGDETIFELLDRRSKDKTIPNLWFLISHLERVTYDILYSYLQKAVTSQQGFKEFNAYQGRMGFDVSIMRYQRDQTFGALLDRTTLSFPNLQPILEILHKQSSKKALTPTDSFCKLVEETIQAPREEFNLKYAQLRSLFEQGDFQADTIAYCLNLPSGSIEPFNKETSLYERVCNDRRAPARVVQALLCQKLRWPDPVTDTPSFIVSQKIAWLSSASPAVGNEYEKEFEALRLLQNYWPINVDTAKTSYGIQVGSEIMSLALGIPHDVEAYNRNGFLKKGLSILEIVQNKRSDTHAVLRELIKAVYRGAYNNDLLISAVEEWVTKFPQEKAIDAIPADNGITIGQYIDLIGNKKLSALFGRALVQTSDGDYPHEKPAPLTEHDFAPLTSTTLRAPHSSVIAGAASTYNDLRNYQGFASRKKFIIDDDNDVDDKAQHSNESDREEGFGTQNNPPKIPFLRFDSNESDIDDDDLPPDPTDKQPIKRSRPTTAPKSPLSGGTTPSNTNKGKDDSDSSQSTSSMDPATRNVPTNRSLQQPLASTTNKGSSVKSGTSVVTTSVGSKTAASRHRQNVGSAGNQPNKSTWSSYFTPQNILLAGGALCAGVYIYKKLIVPGRRAHENDPVAAHVV